MNNDFSDPWPRMVICGIALLVFGALWLAGYQECMSKGGAYVESGCTMECVEVKR